MKFLESSDCPDSGADKILTELSTELCLEILALRFETMTEEVYFIVRRENEF